MSPFRQCRFSQDNFCSATDTFLNDSFHKKKICRTWGDDIPQTIAETFSKSSSSVWFTNRRNPWHHWFQQDSATGHTANETITSLKQTSCERLISFRRLVTRPLRSCRTIFCEVMCSRLSTQLSPKNWRLWREYSANFRRPSVSIAAKIYRKLHEKWAGPFIRANQGGYLPEVIFKTEWQILISIAKLKPWPQHQFICVLFLHESRVS